MIAGLPGAASARAVSWQSLAGWRDASLAEAMACLVRSANARAMPPLRPASPPPSRFSSLLDRVAAMPQAMSQSDARNVFEANFLPCRVEPDGGSGFLTGYYEPVVEGSLTSSPLHTAPVLAWPGDTEARSRDRAQWEAYAVTRMASPIVWLRDWVEVFLIHVQGSARVALPDGRRLRLVYAGRNGAPYTSIGRRLIETGRIAPDEMSLATLKAWLRRHGDEARALMRENRSYIFFKLETDDCAGPIGGQGLPLQPLRSIAVDRQLWCYGLPFWIETERPVPGFGPDPLRRLFVAQDTGSAIVGPARVDLFLGSGEAAGQAAGSIRHDATVTVLLPHDVS